MFAFIIIVKQFRTPEKQRQMSFTAGKKQQLTTFSDSQLTVQTRLKKKLRGINVHGRSIRSKLALN